MIWVYFDGSCTQNPGGQSKYGFVVRRDAVKIHEASGIAAEAGPSSTNNLAEYTGCLKALQWLKGNGLCEAVMVLGDSQLVIRQLQGLYRVNSPLLRPLYERVRELAGTFPSCKFKWIPREQNTEADRLSKIG
jgi:ribonuclease HI